MTKTQVRIVEQAGDQLSMLLTNSNPFKTPCMREGCTVCAQDGKEGSCYTSNVVYTSECSICAKSDTKDTIYKYIGETSRTLREREREHQQDYLNKPGKSHRREHVSEHHPQLSWEEDPFTIKVLKVHRTAFTRLVHEAQVIQKHGHGESLLNKKEEYSRNLLPELTLDEPAWRKKDQQPVKQAPKGAGEKRTPQDQQVQGGSRSKRRRKERETPAPCRLKEMFRRQEERHLETKMKPSPEGDSSKEMEARGEQEGDEEQQQLFCRLVDLGETGALWDNWTQPALLPAQDDLTPPQDHQGAVELEADQDSLTPPQDHQELGIDLQEGRGGASAQDDLTPPQDHQGAVELEAVAGPGIDLQEGREGAPEYEPGHEQEGDEEQQQLFCNLIDLGDTGNLGDNLLPVLVNPTPPQDHLGVAEREVHQDILTPPQDHQGVAELGVEPQEGREGAHEYESEHDQEGDEEQQRLFCRMIDLGETGNLGDNWTQSKPKCPITIGDQDYPHEEQVVDPEEDALLPDQDILTHPQDHQGVVERGVDHDVHTPPPQDHQGIVELEFEFDFEIDFEFELEHEGDHQDILTHPQDHQGVERGVDQDIHTPPQDHQGGVELEVDHQDKDMNLGTEIEPEDDKVEGRKVEEQREVMVVEMMEVEIEMDNQIPRFSRKRKRNKGHMSRKLREIEVEHDRDNETDNFQIIANNFQEITQDECMLSETVSELPRDEIQTCYDKGVNETSLQLSNLEINTQYEDMEIETKSDSFMNDTVFRLSRLEINTLGDDDYILSQTISQLARLEIGNSSYESQDIIHTRQEQQVLKYFQNLKI